MTAVELAPWRERFRHDDRTVDGEDRPGAPVPATGTGWLADMADRERTASPR